MQKTSAIIAILLFAVSAHAMPVIGVFADEVPYICYADVTPYVPLTLYVVSYWEPGEMGAGVTAAEFKIANFPTNDGYPSGTVTVNHTTDLVIGDIWTDYSAAWNIPQDEGNKFTICGIEVLAFDASWIPGQLTVLVTEGDDCSCLLLVDDIFEIVPARGGQFTFNCSNPPCDCFPPTSTRDTSWSSVKALF